MFPETVKGAPHPPEIQEGLSPVTVGGKVIFRAGSGVAKVKLGV